MTGGIVLKLQVASNMTDFSENIWILDGRQPQRIIEAVTTNQTLGTRISRRAV